MRTRKAPNTDFFYSVSAFSVNSFSRRLFRLDLHCVKSVRTWRFFCPYFPAFKQNTESNSLSSRIQYGCGELWTRKLRIRTIFTQCFLQPNEFFILAVDIYTRALQTKILYPEATAGGVLWKKVFLKIYARQLRQSLFFDKVQLY